MAVAEQTSEARSGRRRERKFWQNISVIFRSPVAVVGLSIVIFWVVVAILAPVLAPYSPTAQDSTAINQGPSASYLLGTDNLGRDMLSRLLYGSRTILLIAPISVLCSVIVGTILGLVGGYFGGLVDEIVMRILDSIMAFPTILLYIMVIV